ncbi:hypothetical protein [Jatrophihabitans fulvus]
MTVSRPGTRRTVLDFTTALFGLARPSARCPSEHYADFLRRTVRCRLDTDHVGDHRYTVFDETVRWS